MPGQATSLSAEDRRLLELLAAGLSLAQAAGELSYSTRTVKRRLAAMRGAYGVRTTAELLARIQGSLDGASESRSKPCTELTNDVLTPRECEVLALVAEGARSEAIATQLGVSRATVETQIGSAMRKLGARTRAQAALLAGTAGRPAAEPGD